jgi:1,4-alpha-glucan branching enzyme
VKTTSPPAFLSDFDLHLMSEGTHLRLYEKLGAHAAEWQGAAGTRFAVWAPNARRVSVIGDFNGWRDDAHEMVSRGSAGIWEGFAAGVGPGAVYKYAIEARTGERLEKADPFGFAAELRPHSASRVAELAGYAWSDAEWMAGRGPRHGLDAPISIYELHLGSWMRVPGEMDRWLSYREVAPRLIEHLRATAFTHVELMPISEHPYDGSWGYQTVGYYAPTSRFGAPHDFMFLVDALHQAGFGVILDWVPAHFPRDGHGLARFDGTHIYEHADPRQGAHPDWGTLIFNYGRTEVQNFLLSNALFWLDRYHIDGLRIDAVASMIYLDYSRREGEWIPNRHGGRENLEAIAFLRRLNEVVYGEYPGTMTIAEESTAWPMVSRPTYVGGLGFGYKWDMGWMHDMLTYMGLDPVHRRYHHHQVTFRMLYAWHENFVLPLSHDEVVHGKGSLIGRMTGDDWQRFANLRLLYASQWAQPGKKLLFMGGEFGQWAEWSHDRSLDWHLLQHAPHQGIQRLIGDLNRLYAAEPALHQYDVDPTGFTWIDCTDTDQSVVSFLRRGRNPDEAVVFAFNFTPVPRHDYRIGVPWLGRWVEVLNTDAAIYGGSGQGNFGGVDATPLPWHGYAQSVGAVLPPLGAVAFKGVRSAAELAPAQAAPAAPPAPPAPPAATAPPARAPIAPAAPVAPAATTRGRRRA